MKTTDFRATNLRATDLMIGDWVKLSKGNWSKNRQVGLTDIEMIAESVYLAEPIPLTPEILEKNGFVKVIDRYIKDTEEWKLCCDKIRITINPFTGYALAYKGAWLPVLNNLYFKNVHELQRALKLCGINKEITL